MEWGESYSSATHPGYRLHYVGFSINQGVLTSFDVGMAGTICRSKWEAMEMDGVAIESDAGDQEV